MSSFCTYVNGTKLLVMLLLLSSLDVSRAQEVTKAESEVSWEEKEWSKLVGVWKAPRSDGTYRIKRITKGNEVSENYSAQGELLNSYKSDMKLDRHYGLNFFTVRIGTPGEYTSIYKVYNGKWYEQLRGIFAEDSKTAPDRFLIYERVKD